MKQVEIIFNDTPNDHIQREFEAFHRQNPHVYKEIVRIAHMMRSRGFQRYSMRTIFHVIRWHTHIKTNDKNFKICNNHSSRYVRLFEKEYPEFRGFFKKRSIGSCN